MATPMTSRCVLACDRGLRTEQQSGGDVHFTRRHAPVDAPSGESTALWCPTVFNASSSGLRPRAVARRSLARGSFGTTHLIGLASTLARTVPRECLINGLLDGARSPRLSVHRAGVYHGRHRRITTRPSPTRRSPLLREPTFSAYPIASSLRSRRTTLRRRVARRCRLKRVTTFVLTRCSERGSAGWGGCEHLPQRQGRRSGLPPTRSHTCRARCVPRSRRGTHAFRARSIELPLRRWSCHRRASGCARAQ